MSMIRFYGDYKEFKSFNKEFSNIDKKGAAAILANILKVCEVPGYLYSGINTSVIDRTVNESVDDKGPNGFVSALKSLKVNKLINESIERKELRPVAKSYIYNRLLNATGIKYYPEMGMPSGKEFSKPGELGFIASVEGWTMIKRVKLDGVKEYEVSAFASRVFSTSIDHMYQFLGYKTDIQKKKIDVKSEILNVKTPYDVYVVFKQFGTLPYPHIQMLIKAYPDLKIRKGRGRLPKG